MLQNALDHSHTVRPLGVAGAHIMGEAVAVGENERIQVNVLPWVLQVPRRAVVSSVIIWLPKTGFALCQLCRRLSFS